MVMEGFSPSVFAPLGATYSNYIDSIYGGNPLAAAYGSAFSPFAQLQYLSNPAVTSPMRFQPYDATTGSGTMNPFNQFLTSGQGFSPLNSTGFAQRAMDVQSILNRPVTDGNLTGDELRIQERFGTGEDAANRQRRLAEAAVVTQMPFALRGETQNILNRLYNQYITGQNPESYLSMAMGAGDDSLWNRFNVTRPEAQSSAGEGTV